MNDKLIVDHAVMESYFHRKQKLPLAPRGPIQLQTHGGQIRWRNIYIKELSADEANAYLREKDGKDYTPIFNGKNLEGWDGDPRLWSVQDGVIHGETTAENKTKGNTFLVWRGGELKNFELQLKYRIIGGNSGIQ